MREYSFNLEAARKYGVDGAILLQGLAFWITKNRANARHFRDGRWWTYNSQEALAKLFPFWTRRQIQRIVKNLNEEGAVLTASYSQGAQHNVTWFALSDEVLRLLGAEECASEELGVRSEELGVGPAGDGGRIATSAPPPRNDTGGESPEKSTAPNGAVVESTAPNGAEYRTEPCGTNRNQLDTTVTPYSPPAGGSARVPDGDPFDALFAAWKGTRNQSEYDTARRDWSALLRAHEDMGAILAQARKWVAAGADRWIPLRVFLEKDNWKEEPFFWLFWQIYPRKLDKDRARRAWKKLKPDQALAAAILEGLRAWKICDQWQDEQYIPHPTTWLNNRRWETPPPAGRGRREPEAAPRERPVEEWT